MNNCNSIFRVVDLVKIIKGKSLTTNITQSLLRSGNNKSLGYLLQCNPSVLDNLQHNLIICRAMPLIIEKVLDVESFICACKFSNELLAVLKDEPKAFHIFTERKNSIIKIFKATINDNDKLASSAIVLIITLIRLQVSYNIYLYIFLLYFIDFNFMRCMLT